jgi:glutamate---cysteine ligase / carboxylate-amine ligase
MSSAAPDLDDHAFGRGPAFAVGVEEELLLVDPETHALAPDAQAILGRLEATPRTVIDHEAYAAELELRSPPCPDVPAAIAALRDARRTAREAGATLMGAGVHPNGALGDAELVDSDRYRRVEDLMRGLIRRTPECALHVHVAMPDPEAAVRALNGLREALPVLQALAANSPFWFGSDSGMASARAALVRSYPGRGVPRAFAGWADYVATAQAALAAGDLPDYTYLWWDVRLQPRLGTVELREVDAQASLRDVAAIAGLVHALARRAVEDKQPETPTASEALSLSAFLASRDGLDASTVDGAGGRTILRERARAMLATLDSAGDPSLEEVERIAREGTGAARQRAAFERGGMVGLLDHLVSATSV